MENIEKKIRENALNLGLLFGLISLVLSILSFYFITSIAKSFWLIAFGPIVFSVIIPIVVIIFFCIDLRKKIGGFWNFKQAATGIAIMFFVSFFIQVVGRDLIFVKLVEPDMVKKTQDAVLNSTTAMMEKSGVDQTQIDKKMDELQKQFDTQKNQSIGKIIQGYAISIILLFAFALIFAAIFKKDPLLPVIDPYETPALE